MLACVVLAALSAAVLPTVPSYDPWSWIVWGREVTDPHLSFVVSGGPSWKPLPFLFTTVWGLFGGAAPTLWVITARAGGLLGLVAAWRLASRLVGGGWAGAFAGVLAVAGVRPDPGLVLLLVPRHLRGRPDRRLAVGGRPAAGRPQVAGVPARRGGLADPPRVVAVHRPVRAVAVVPRPRFQALADAPAAAGRTGQPPGALVRAAVGRLRSAVPGRHPRRRVQRSSRIGPVPDGPRPRHEPAGAAGAGVRRGRGGDRLVARPQSPAADPGRRRGRLVGGSGRHDARRLSGPGALLPARRGPDLRARRRRARAPGPARRERRAAATPPRVARGRRRRCWC